MSFLLRILLGGSALVPKPLVHREMGVGKDSPPPPPLPLCLQNKTLRGGWGRGAEEGCGGRFLGPTPRRTDRWMDAGERGAL